MRLARPTFLAVAVSLLPALALAEEPAAPAPAPAPSDAPGDASTPPGQPGAPAKETLRQLFERELGPLPLVDFTSPAGVKGKVEAVAPVEIAAEEGAERLTIRLGSDQPVFCRLSRGRLDAGASTSGLAETVAKSLEIVAAQPIEVSTEGGTVVVFSEILYRQATDKGALAGQFKVAVHPHGTHSLLCFHDEPGYSATFRRVVKALAASLQSDAVDERAQARFAELMVTEVGGRPIGYVERDIWEREGGARRAVTFEAMILPRSPKDLMAIDEFTLEESDAAGLLTAVQTVHALNGELDLDVQLTRGDAPRTFAYKGQKAGKPIEGTFKAKDGLASELWFASRLAAAAGGKGKARPALKLAHDSYSAGADPAAPTRLTYARDAKARDHASVTVGPMTVTGVLDEYGLMKDVDIPLGPAVLTMRRVWSRGSP